MVARPLPLPERATVRPATIAIRNLTIAALLAIAFVALVARFVVAPLDRFDEGVTVLKGMLVSEGLLPYRDFWTSYGPLDSVVLGGLFKIFGIQVLVERLFAVALAVIFTASSWWLCGRIGLRGTMRILLTGLMALDAVTFPPPLPTILAILLGLLTIGAFLGNLHRPSPTPALIGGALTGVVAFTRPEFALVLIAGIGTGYGVLAVRRRSGAVRALLAFLGAACLTGALLWTPVAVAAGWSTLVFDVVTHALVIYPSGRRIPLGQGDDGLAVLAFSACFVAIWAWGVARAIRHRSDAIELARLSGLLVLSVLAFDWVWTRADALHAMAAWPLSAVLLAVLLERRTAGRPRLPGETTFSMVALGLFAVIIGVLAGRDLARPADPVGIPHAAIVGGRAWMPGGQLAEVVAAIDALAPAGEPIFVGLQHNDQVVFNDAMLYVLAGRRPGTVYEEYIPALTTDARIQRRMTCQMARSGTHVAVLGPNGAGEPWNASARPGATVLDGWLGDHAAASRRLDPYVLVTLRLNAADRSCTP